MNKLIFTIMAMVTLTSVGAPPPPGGHRPPAHRPPPQSKPYHHHHKDYTWIVGLAAVTGYVFAENLFKRPTPEPVVIQQPVTPVVVRPRQIWIPGYYQDQIVNGQVVRTWIPGHYEVR